MQRHHSLRLGLQPLLRWAGLRQVHFHSLRRFASAMILEGAHVTEVAGILGHPSPQTTLQVYLHWFESVQTSSAAMTNMGANILGGKERKQQAVGG